MRGKAFVMCIVFASGALSNPDKTRTAYNKCLAQLATEQRKIDQVMNPAKARCDNTGVCVEVSIGSGIGQAMSRSDTFIKGEECMYRLDEYESACNKAEKDCVYTTFDEVYR